MAKPAFKVGDIVICQVETRKSGFKTPLSRPLQQGTEVEEREFPIIRIHYPYEGSEPMYTILLQEDLSGWIVNKFHINYHDIAACFESQKFWELPEFYIKKK